MIREEFMILNSGKIAKLGLNEISNVWQIKDIKGFGKFTRRVEFLIKKSEIKN
jgi:hypothetical protein